MKAISKYAKYCKHGAYGYCFICDITPQPRRNPLYLVSKQLWHNYYLRGVNGRSRKVSCKHTNTIHTRQIRHEYGLLEYDVTCCKCKQVLNTWAYGHYEYENGHF